MVGTVTAPGTTTDWLRRFHPPGRDEARLVCFPHAGGSATFFHPVSARFAPTAEVLAVQYPGRQDRHREPCLTSVAELADRLAVELAALPARPTVFFGHSMGALVGFETARRLERDAPGSAPRSLVVSGRRAPSTRRPERVHELDDAGLLAEVRALDGPDMSALDDDFLALVLPALRHDYRAVETYRADDGAVVGCPVLALTGRDDPRTTPEEADAWRRHTDGGFELEVMPGHHFFLVDQARAVCDRLDEQLARAHGGRARPPRG